VLRFADLDEARLKLVYRLLLPAIAAATCVLGYYTYLTAMQFERLGEKSLAESSLWLVQDRVNRLEQTIIAADNNVLAAVNLDEPESALADWKLRAEEIAPSVRAMIVLDVQRRVVDAQARATDRDRQQFMRLFLRTIVPDLKLESLPYNVLNHLHKSYDGRSYLISYKAVRHHGRRFYLAAHQDTGYLIRTVFPELFRSESGKEWHNVVDEDNRRVFGPNLASAGDYVVGLRFPTTLYAWRLQVAPKTAPLLKEKGRTSRFNQAALIGLSLAVILIAVAFILYAADKERRLANLKSEFIANVSHELKTPLSVIRMFSEMLLTKRVRDATKQEEYLGIICSETERLTNLIENVLDFAALERGKRKYLLQPALVSDVVARAIDTFRYRFEREGAELHLFEYGGPAHARIDEQAITLAVINLLDNAVKYGEGTPVDVTIETHDHEVSIRVRDRGPGIPPQDLKRVFERFYRSAGSGKTRGSGIGLSLVKHIAEAHGGRALADNAAEGGAAVTLRLPRREPGERTDPGRRRSEPDPSIDRAEATDIVARHG
jgi:two-component system, OmpR family, phosphate regulon sensor histidine kinase PhoR